jgi:hypothetical protein
MAAMFSMLWVRAWTYLLFPVSSLRSVTAYLFMGSGIGNPMQREQSFKKLTWEMPEENYEEIVFSIIVVILYDRHNEFVINQILLYYYLLYVSIQLDRHCNANLDQY